MLLKKKKKNIRYFHDEKQASSARVQLNNCPRIIFNDDFKVNRLFQL